MSFSVRLSPVTARVPDDFDPTNVPTSEATRSPHESEPPMSPTEATSLFLERASAIAAEHGIPFIKAVEAARSKWPELYAQVPAPRSEPPPAPRGRFAALTPAADGDVAARFNAAVEAVRVEKGITFNEAVDAVKATRPELYAEFAEADSRPRVRTSLSTPAPVLEDPDELEKSGAAAKVVTRARELQANGRAPDYAVALEIVRQEDPALWEKATKGSE
jgi:hypothetical protein